VVDVGTKGIELTTGSDTQGFIEDPLHHLVGEGEEEEGGSKVRG